MPIVTAYAALTIALMGLVSGVGDFSAPKATSESALSTVPFASALVSS